MLSWVFRNRRRLAAIYGMVSGGTDVGADPAEPDPAAGGAAPGRVVRRRHWTVLWPMSPALCLEEILEDEDWSDWL